MTNLTEKEIIELSKYSIYNLNEIGPILADIINFITGKKYVFEILEKAKTLQIYVDCTVCSRWEQAILKIEGTDDVFLIVESHNHFTKKYNGKTKIVTKLKEKERLAYFQDGKFICNLEPNYLANFINDVSLYRLQNNITDISLEELEKLKQLYLEKQEIINLQNERIAEETKEYPPYQDLNEMVKVFSIRPKIYASSFYGGSKVHD